MFAFLISAAALYIAGPTLIDPAYAAVQEHGIKDAIVMAWDAREALDYSKMND